MRRINTKVSDELVSRKKATKKTWLQILTAGVTLFENGDLSGIEKAPLTPKRLQGEFELALDKELHVLVKRVWVKRGLGDIRAGEIFRIWKDGQSEEHYGWKCFSYLEHPYEKYRRITALCVGRKIPALDTHAAVAQ